MSFFHTSKLISFFYFFSFINIKAILFGTDFSTSNINNLCNIMLIISSVIYFLVLCLFYINIYRISTLTIIAKVIPRIFALVLYIILNVHFGGPELCDCASDLYDGA